MKTIEPWKRWLFVCGLGLIAIVINSTFARLRPPDSIYVERPAAPAIQQQPASTQPERRYEPVIQATPSPQTPMVDMAAQHATYLAKYVNAAISREPGKQAVAIVAASENGKFNRALVSAIATKCKSQKITLLPSFFTPQFVSDGLFDKAFDGSMSVLRDLDLADSVDALVLARQKVQYSIDRSLENVITATMQLDLSAFPTGPRGDTRAWTFTASGAGFKQPEARAMAEERLLKQIANSTNISLATVVSDTQ